jgi:hypothetical protein
VLSISSRWKYSELTLDVTSAASSSGVASTTSAASSATAAAFHARLLCVFAFLASDRLVVEALGEKTSEDMLISATQLQCSLIAMRQV